MNTAPREWLVCGAAVSTPPCRGWGGREEERGEGREVGESVSTATRPLLASHALRSGRACRSMTQWTLCLAG